MPTGHAQPSSPFTWNSLTAMLLSPPLLLALVSASAERCCRQTARMKGASGMRMPMASTPVQTAMGSVQGGLVEDRQ